MNESFRECMAIIDQIETAELEAHRSPRLQGQLRLIAAEVRVHALRASRREREAVADVCIFRNTVHCLRCTHCRHEPTP